jgi:hypothetical protein
MKFRFMALAFVALTSAPALAEGMDEIVVTASRYQERFEQVRMPAITLQRRADFVVVDLSIESDSRDLELRRGELSQTLKDLAQKAKPGGAVSVAILEENDDETAGETRIRPYSYEAAMALVRGGGRPDTSRLTLLLRTAVGKDDTLESISDRLDAFVRTLQKPGRIAVSTGEENLTLVNPAQYRRPLIESVAADAKATIAMLGAGYGATITGLESRVAWKRSADLELTLYMPYAMVIEPTPAR